MIAFKQEAFWNFYALLSRHHDVIPMKWVTNELDLNSLGVEYLSFEPKDHSIRTVFRDPVTKLCNPDFEGSL
jgi:hypothetical protein